MKPESCTTEAGPVRLRAEVKLKEHGGAKGSQQMEVRGRARGSTGGAGQQSESKLLGGANEGGADGLNEASGDRAEELGSTCKRL